ncbi:pyruvate dehydrogenase E1 component subunit alpha, mitochondrial-like [Chrysoperla carnea]|uniref:pyruvate dehydrogenase E1 component subunit alpha, mitochondrial-like n=1 Tax=Chrysoperla carnea TaxID=189513 RepID=UPI001D06E3D1|nr:pyruvate dehydrogenase E1 component subunit alpha, mitochondrial-like [Chrysoperla carnea]
MLRYIFRSKLLWNHRYVHGMQKINQRKSFIDDLFSKVNSDEAEAQFSTNKRDNSSPNANADEGGTRIQLTRIKTDNLSSNCNEDGAEIQLPPNKMWLLDKGPPTKAMITREEGVQTLKEMTFYRELESEILKLYQKKLIRGYCHLYNGQEAVCSGCVKALREGDKVITAYRCHMWVCKLGTPPLDMVAECLQKETGNVKGRGGSMHMYNEKLFGGNGIVGAHVPLGTGIAFAMKTRNEKNVCVTVFGDGAANQGQVFEALNLAALHKLPIIYLIENNQYGMGTSISRSSATSEYFRRIDFVPGIWVDGMNYIGVRECMKFAINHAQEHGPIIVEANTYRYMGHSVSDPGIKYRSRQEIDHVRDTVDPIKTLSDILIKANFLTPDDRKSITEEQRKIVKEISDKANADKMPSLNELCKNIYAKPIETTVRGTNAFDCHDGQAYLSLLIQSKREM